MYTLRRKNHKLEFILSIIPTLREPEFWLRNLEAYSVFVWKDIEQQAVHFCNFGFIWKYI